MVVLAASAVLVAKVSAQAAARSSAPVAGTWGAEAAVGDGQSAALLRFLSPQWALIAGGSVSSFKSTNSLGDGSQDFRITRASLQVGARRYARSGLGVRPVVGAGLLLNGATGVPTAYGAYGELGAVYFFNPHVSLGAIGTASVTRNNPFGTSVAATLARLTGTVYF